MPTAIDRRGSMKRAGPSVPLLLLGSGAVLGGEGIWRVGLVGVLGKS